MSFLSDIFNPTLLIFLGITLLIIALLIVYFEGKMREQNHKISSMLSLVSSLAEETNMIKFHLNHANMNVYQAQNNSLNSIPFTQGINLEEKLIHVSDDEDDDEDEEDIKDLDILTSEKLYNMLNTFFVDEYGVTIATSMSNISYELHNLNKNLSKLLKSKK